MNEKRGISTNSRLLWLMFPSAGDTATKTFNLFSSFVTNRLLRHDCQRSKLRQLGKYLKASTVYFLAPSSRSCDCTPKIPPTPTPIHNNNTTTHATRPCHCACVWHFIDSLCEERKGREHWGEQCLCFTDKVNPSVIPKSFWNVGGDLTKMFTCYVAIEI